MTRTVKTHYQLQSQDKDGNWYSAPMMVRKATSRKDAESMVPFAIEIVPGLASRPFRVFQTTECHETTSIAYPTI